MGVFRRCGQCNRKMEAGICLLCGEVLCMRSCEQDVRPNDFKLGRRG
jgi:hypothetical protein